MLFYFLALLPVIILFLGIIYYLQGPPFVASDDETTKEIVALVRKYKGKRVIDIGSGDGKLVIALAKAGYDAYGVELNPWLVFKSKQKIRQLQLNNAHIMWGNFWTYDLSAYDTVVLYCIKHIMHRLGQKMDKELPKTATIITNFFIFPNWKPVEQKDRAVVYKKK
jgi:16S rRNA A1518/A1519 N6-dimethyltransferase RsmA/KsgA/DIM1 with predicted DNA glycosylase/AP lyase activity